MKLILIFIPSLLFLGIPLYDKMWTQKIFIDFTWPCLLFLVLFFLFNLLKLFKNYTLTLSCLFKKYRGHLLLCLILTLCVFISVEVKFKTLSDETNLLAKSRSLAFEKKPLNMTDAKNYFETTRSLHYELPKRPLLFPFAVSLLHSFLGYHTSNVFVLNFFTLFVFLSLISVAGASLLPPLISISIPLWILSQPVISIFSCSGGFDVFSLTFFFISMAILLLFLNQPDQMHFECLWLALILYANTRYESILLAVLILPFLWKMGYLPFSLLRSSFSLSLTPFFTAPLVWQKWIKTNVYENPDGTALFSLGSFFENLKEFLISQCRFDFHLPYNPFLFFMGIAVISLLVWKIFSSSPKIPKSLRCFILIFTLIFFVFQILYLCHFFGRFSHPSSARFFLIYAATFSLIPFSLYWIFPRIPAALFPALGLVFFLLYHPVAVKDSFTNALTLNRKTDYTYQFLRNRPSDTLIIVDRPGQYTVMNFGAVSFEYANDHVQELLTELKAGLYPDILVIQDISREKLKTLPDQKLDKAFPLRLLDKKMTCAETYVRISKVDKKKL